MKRERNITTTIRFEGKPAEELEHGEVEDPERETMDKIEAVLQALHEAGVITHYELRYGR